MKNLEFILEFITPGIIILVVIALSFINRWIFNKISLLTNGKKIAKKVSFFSIIFLGVLFFIMSLPIDKVLKGQAIGLIGIVMSAGIALSSTNILGNLIAGIMNNSMDRFKIGDLIEINDFRGRVVRKSFFHTEIQTEDSNFVTIPNLYISSNPVVLTRETKTVVSTSVSLGYDVDRIQVEKSLIEAAEICKLESPYVYITVLGDYSITYKIHGFLEDASGFFSTKSRLNGMVIDALHGKNIEIVSPSFINKRTIDETPVIPRLNNKPSKKEEVLVPEELVFDEAIKSEKIEEKKQTVKNLYLQEEKIEELIKDTDDENDIVDLEKKLERIEKLKNIMEKSIKKNIEE